jgi:hypothetical protein
MKIIWLIGILSLLFLQVLTQKTITCYAGSPSERHPACMFADVTIGPNETVTIKIKPEDTDPKTIQWVQFLYSSIYSVPRELFSKFPNLKVLFADVKEIQEIGLDTFKNGKNLEVISLTKNKLTFLDVVTFQGKNLSFIFFCKNFEPWKFSERFVKFG